MSVDSVELDALMKVLALRTLSIVLVCVGGRGVIRIIIEALESYVEHD